MASGGRKPPDARRVIVQIVVRLVKSNFVGKVGALSGSVRECLAAQGANEVFGGSLWGVIRG
jgi:hypothetical protein